MVGNSKIDPAPSRSIAGSDARAQDPRAAVDVFYDGGCPICRREISALRKMRGAEHMRWIDLTSDELPEGANRCEMLARMHVRRRDGQIARGAAAFVAMWRGLGWLRPFGRVLDFALPRWLLERAYRLHLAIRPLWYRSAPR